MKPIKDYHPRGMSFTDGFLGPRGNVGFTMEYSHDKVMKIIQKLVKEGRSITYAEAGLDGDWDVNNCEVYDGKTGVFLEYTEYDSSIWAPPILMVHFSDGPSEMYPVWTRTIEVKDDTIKQLK